MTEIPVTSNPRIKKCVEKLRTSLAYVFIVALIASLVLAYPFCKCLPTTCKKNCWNWQTITQAAVLAAWILLPPIWFWIEYFFGSWETNANFGEKASRFERLKYGQDISSKIWIAVSTVLLMLYFGKDLHP